MKLIKPSIEFLSMTPNPLEQLELAGRTCYKSEDKITSDSCKSFVQKLLDRKHYAMIEHASISYKVICDRGVTHEIVRHRLFSYAQESTRYCNYKGGVTFIIPPWIDLSIGTYTFNFLREKITTPNGLIINFNTLGKKMLLWAEGITRAGITYQDLLEEGWTPQQARSVLPNSLKTEIVITGNLREWRHFFSLRCTPLKAPQEDLVNDIWYHATAPHPQMQEIANMILKDIRTKIPVLFEDF